MAIVLNWDGDGVPDELRDLPRGRYVIESIDDAPPLTEDQEAGIAKAIASVEQGRGTSLEAARETVESTPRPLKIVLAPEAVEDWTSAVEYVRERSPRAAERLADRIASTIVGLADGHLEGPEQTLSDGVRVRSWPVPPYRVYYRRSQDDELIILRVYHGARAPLVR